MARINLRTTAAALALTFGAFSVQAQAADVLDHSNSASATGNPFAYDVAVTQERLGASPVDVSNSASAVGSAFAFNVPTSTRMAGVLNINWSNSASAVDTYQPVLSSRSTLLASH